MQNADPPLSRKGASALIFPALPDFRNREILGKFEDLREQAHDTKKLRTDVWRPLLKEVICKCRSRSYAICSVKNGESREGYRRRTDLLNKRRRNQRITSRREKKIQGLASLLWQSFRIQRYLTTFRGVTNSIEYHKSCASAVSVQKMSFM